MKAIRSVYFIWSEIDVPKVITVKYSLHWTSDKRNHAALKVAIHCSNFYLFYNVPEFVDTVRSICQNVQ